MSKEATETGRKSDPQNSMHHLLNVQEADSKRQGKPTKTKRKGKPTDYQEKKKALLIMSVTISYRKRAS